MSQKCANYGCRAGIFSTQSLKEILGLHASRLRIAVRDVHQDMEYVAPRTIWERIKQVFTGPINKPRYGRVDVAVLTNGHVITDQERAELRAVVKEYVPLTVRVNFIEYEG
jgi:hypothetical protein